MKRICKAMENWTDARVMQGLAYHNLKFHKEDVARIGGNALRAEKRADEDEKAARKKLHSLIKE